MKTRGYEWAAAAWLLVATAAGAQGIADVSALGAHGEVGRRAVALATGRDYAGALKLAETLLPQAQEQEAEGAIRAVIASLKRNARMKADIIAGARAPRKKRVYVEFSGTLMTGKLVDADDTRILVGLLGNEMPFRWKDLGDRRFYFIARKFIAKNNPRKRLDLAAYCIEKGLQDEAHKQLDEALKSDSSLSGDVRALRALILDRSKTLAGPTEEKKGNSRSRPMRTRSRRTPAGKRAATSAAVGRYEGVYAGRPRLFVRDTAWAGGKGLTVAALQQRARTRPWKGMLGFLDHQRASVACRAMKWLASGDTKAAEDAVRRLQRKTVNGGTTTDGDELEHAAIAFDWVFGYPGFDDSRKRQAADLLAATANTLIRRLDTGSHIFHTRMYAWANGVGFAGLALDGYHPEAKKFIDYAKKYQLNKLFPGRQHQDGAWHNSMSYGRKYACRSTFHWLSAWHSATGENLWATVKNKQNDWAEKMLYHLIYAWKPNHTYAGFGDRFQSFWTTDRGAYDVLAEASSAYRNPYGKWLLDEVRRKWGGRNGKGLQAEYGYYHFLFYDPTIQAKPLSGLPTSMMFGQHSLGYVYMRSDWSADCTWIFFKCGDYFGDHGHFDQGSFEIWRKAPLALDAGLYQGGFRGGHRINFFRQSVAHNTILVSDPNDSGDTGNQRVFQYQSAGNIKQYLGKKVAQTGDIIEYRRESDYTYVSGDVTAAYRPDRVRKFTRQIVFFKKKHLVVFDTVQVARAGLRRRFLLHYPTDANVQGKVATIDNGGSRLICQTLLPANARIAKLPAYSVNGKVIGFGGGVKYPNIGGNGRLEIEPPTNAGTSTLFLNVLTIGPAGTRAPACKVESSGGSVTLTLEGAKLVFKAGHGFQLR